MLALRRKQITPQPEPEHIEMPAPPREAPNPFTVAHDDLASRWDKMKQERDEALDAAERERGINVFQASEIDRLKRELEIRTSLFDTETARLQQRADRAIDSETLIRAKLESLRDLLSAVLNDRVPAPPVPLPAPSIAPPPPPHDDLRQPDAAVQALLNQLGPPQLMQPEEE